MLQMTVNTVPVVIVDLHPLIRKGMENMLRCDPRLELVGEADSCAAVVEMCKRLSPRLILVGIDVLDEVWSSVIKALRGFLHDSKIIIISSHEKDKDLEKSLHIGADAYLTKNLTLQDTLNCLQAVLEGRHFATTEQFFRLLTQDQAIQLTPRERDILEYIAKGMSNKLIARAAGIGVSTVKFHVKSIMSKLEARTRLEITVVAAKRGLVHLN